jgi:hypothetical protein
MILFLLYPEKPLLPRLKGRGAREDGPAPFHQDVSGLGSGGFISKLVRK